MTKRGEILVGTSGWHYRHWVGPFYPAGTDSNRLLAFYAQEFRSVEINNSFYRLPDRETLIAWREATPDGFVFACKASRIITHMKKPKDTEEPTRRFLDAAGALGDKLGPILFQLPPHWHANAERLAQFLALLPQGFRVAFEFRDESWFAAPIFRLLERHGAACCAYDLDGRRSPVQMTADFAYVRLHAPDGPYRGCYDGRALGGWARRLRAWQRSGLDAYCYFDNDEAGYAATNALVLSKQCGATAAF
ncbi:MAG TPA: DUF72 domain-containing protein [Acetobacteraceae bacterium]|nr:DUF72 domain-containing protein [Acetobacteraceae bacterium]